MYRQVITYEELKWLGVRKGVCEVCGKRGRRQRTFTMTENPWNIMFMSFGAGTFGGAIVYFLFTYINL